MGDEMAISYYRTSSAKVTAAGMSRIFYGPACGSNPLASGSGLGDTRVLRWGYPRYSREAGGGEGGG